jgi:hypothetical protein
MIAQVLTYKRDHVVTKHAMDFIIRHNKMKMTRASHGIYLLSVLMFSI